MSSDASLASESPAASVTAPGSRRKSDRRNTVSPSLMQAMLEMDDDEEGTDGGDEAEITVSVVWKELVAEGAGRGARDEARR